MRDEAHHHLIEQLDVVRRKARRRGDEQVRHLPQDGGALNFIPLAERGLDLGAKQVQRQGVRHDGP
jgi:hypothetical protein